MRIASLVVRARPGHLSEVRENISAIPGVVVHAESAEKGSLIVTVEDGEGYAVADSILAVSLADHVLCSSLAYEYSDDGLEQVEA